jgi:hypothetical protein
MNQEKHVLITIHPTCVLDKTGYHISSGGNETKESAALYPSSWLNPSKKIMSAVAGLWFR